MIYTPMRRIPNETHAREMHAHETHVPYEMHAP